MRNLAVATMFGLALLLVGGVTAAIAAVLVVWPLARAAHAVGRA
jgi:hypothetical protein